MGGNKKKEILFTSFICAVMVGFMGLFTMAVQSHSLSLPVLIQAARCFIPAYLFALIIELLVVSRVAKRVAVKIADPDENSPGIVILTVSFCMVCCMSFCMTWFGAVMQNGLTSNVVPFFLNNWPRCFMVALFSQWFFAGPFSRYVFSRLGARLGSGAGEKGPFRCAPS